jgi:UDP-2,3-diacylglucosamine pyrophosphatase LpxH
VRSGAIDFEFYATLLVAKMGTFRLAPGELIVVTAGEDILVQDGDTLCCACSRDEAAAGRCHRVWVAEALAKAGWAVVLDGVEVVRG